eukprot:CAMPEP_0181302564 /NCGR_PEP_ID=MMETSP1101-20121128/8064_1 /TAXON_ID=46948 /ORGANISM="Rhodomonas abbreviata, Strain Caron Lab Isolate" /LENGTH=997 /DNA_ID=CAMNT_0023408023 /DNA_START=95 /DNA_END=3088 /DNA_ORIENTATION=+
MSDDQSGPKRARAEEDGSERTPKQSKTEEVSDEKTFTPFAIRRGKGTRGKVVSAITNYYRLKMDQHVNIFQYEVIVKEQGSTEFEDDKLGLSKGIKLDVMKALEKKLGTTPVAFNAAPTLVSPYKLKDPESGTEVDEMSVVVDVPKPNEKRKRNFEVKLRLTRVDNVAELLDHCQREGGDVRGMNNLIHLLTSLNVIFHCGPLVRMIASRGPWHYTKTNFQQISKASDLYRAFSQNVKFSEQGLVLNFNSGAGVFYREMELVDLFAPLGIRMDAVKRLDQNELKRVNKLLGGLKLKVFFPHTQKEGKSGKRRQPETVKGIAFDDKTGAVVTAGMVTFLKKDGELLQKKLRYVAKSKNGGTRTEKIDFDSVIQSLEELNEKNQYKTTPPDSVRQMFDALTQEEGKVEIDEILHKICPPTRMLDYFQDTYNMKLSVDVPIIWTGSKKKKSFHYLLHAWIAPGQRKNKADPGETEQMIKLTSDKPPQRMRMIDGMCQGEARFGEDPVVQAFSLQIQRQMITVDDARVLPPPRIETTHGRDVQFKGGGDWDHRGSLFSPIEGLLSWGILVTDRFYAEHMVKRFKELMEEVCREKGIKLNPPHVHFLNNSSNLQDDLKGFSNEVSEIASQKAKQKMPTQLIVVMKGPDNGSVSYSEIKRVCDCELGVPTTCCNSKKMKGEFKFPYVKGIVLKINAKLGGYSSGGSSMPPSMNWKVHLPFPNNVKTMVFGIDVSHPAPGSRQPSVGAITALMDRYGSRYLSRYKAQSRRVEVGIPDMEDMIAGLIEDFSQSCMGPPDAIVVYRDGVSESQFDQVLATEVRAFQNVARNLSQTAQFQQNGKGNWMPTITYIVSQKRNNTRFFPANPRDASRNGNFEAGFVCDTTIVNPRMFDFHLLSHSGLQGTSRPVYYHVLLNEGDYTPDAIQELTYALCYGYSRCTKSIGCVTPIYYADKVAERVRLYYGGDWDDFMSDTGTAQSTVSGGSDRQPETKVIHENMRETMFFL